MGASVFVINDSGIAPDVRSFVANYSDESVSIVVLASVYFAGSWHNFPPNHYYGGVKSWALQPKEQAHGNLGLDEFLKSMGIGCLYSGAWLRIWINEGEVPALYRYCGDRNFWVKEFDLSLTPGRND